MSIVEVGCMGVRPGLKVMDETTEEGCILTDCWNAVYGAPGGPSWIFWGLEKEDPNRIWTFFAWNSIEEHENFARSAAPKVLADLPKILTHSLFVKHVAIQRALERVLRSKTVQIALHYLEVDHQREELNTAVQNRLLKVDRCSFGYFIEDEIPILYDLTRTTPALAVFTGLDDGTGDVVGAAVPKAAVASAVVHVSCYGVGCDLEKV